MDVFTALFLLASLITSCTAAALPGPRPPFPVPGAAVIEARQAAATGTVSLSNVSLAVSTASVTGVPARQKADDCTPKTVCYDYLNDCAIRWGACLDKNNCDGKGTTITPPVCSSTTSSDASSDGTTSSADVTTSSYDWAV